MTKKKRRRGAQAGNQNATKHGLYASQLNSAQLQALELAEQMSPDDLEAEIALLRSRISVLLKAAPDRFDLLVKGLRTLAHLTAVRHRLGADDADQLRHSVERLLTGLGHQLLVEPEP